MEVSLKTLRKVIKMNQFNFRKEAFLYHQGRDKEGNTIISCSFDCSGKDMRQDKLPEQSSQL